MGALAHRKGNVQPGKLPNVYWLAVWQPGL